MRRLTLVATIAAGLLFGTSCSKTEDTAPETRLFGEPPEIQNVFLDQSQTGQATCDITAVVKGFLCELGGITTNDVDVPTITLTVNYTEVQFRVQAVDPNTVAGGQNDILLVAASYIRSQGGQPVETSLVLLDDGSTNTFDFLQTTLDITQECPIGGCACTAAHYALASNDAVANDNTWTRGAALLTGENTIMTFPTDVNAGTRKTLAGDCIASGRPQSPGSIAISGGKKQYPAITAVPVGSPLEFKIEVVDRAGNLAVWPSRPAATFNTTTFACNGDECACCLLFSSDPGQFCRQRPGLTGPAFPQGVCAGL